jgi:ubiquinone/menaquinone biosynthesis C-methylase UbiE
VGEGDVLRFDGKAARHTEALYLTPDIVAQRRRVLDALRLRAGERVADLGCGPGLLVLDMHAQVGDDGAIEGIDLSSDMIALAQRRCAGRTNIGLRVGDVAALPYDDAAFDAAACTQVYEYVPDVPRALRELQRVVRPGGRVAVMDTDWESCVWHSSDEPRMRRVIDAWNMHCPHPHLPRTLGRLLREAGFGEVRCEAVPLVNLGYELQTYSYGVIPLLARYAAGPLGEDAARAWAEDLRALGARGEYFFSVNRFLFCAQRV